jgi:Arc/MetJ family transcription regulator
MPSTRTSFPATRRTPARFVFLDPRSQEFYLDCDRVAAEVVAILRSEAGRAQYDRGLTDLVKEPGSKSDEGLKLLAGWAATPDDVETATATDQG